jgi:hypothetical protein
MCADEENVSGSASQTGLRVRSSSGHEWIEGTAQCAAVGAGGQVPGGPEGILSFSFWFGTEG